MRARTLRGSAASTLSISLMFMSVTARPPWPRSFPALLMSATMLEREGSVKAAATAYGAALANAPPESYLDRPTLQAVVHAREVHGNHTRELNDFIRARVDDTQSQCAPVTRR